MRCSETSPFEDLSLHLTHSPSITTQRSFLIFVLPPLPLLFSIYRVVYLENPSAIGPFYWVVEGVFFACAPTRENYHYTPTHWASSIAMASTSTHQMVSRSIQWQLPSAQASKFALLNNHWQTHRSSFNSNSATRPSMPAHTTHTGKHTSSLKAPSSVLPKLTDLMSFSKYPFMHLVKLYLSLEL